MIQVIRTITLIQLFQYFNTNRKTENTCEALLSMGEAILLAPFFAATEIDNTRKGRKLTRFRVWYIPNFQL
jgi:hypothetical protein